MTERKNRVRKLTMQKRDLIRELKAQGWTGKDIAELMGVTQARVSQICSNYYGEFEVKE